MTNTLAEVKRAMKAVTSEGGQLRKVAISAEEFGEGYNVYVDIMYWTQEGIKTEYYTMVEEEKKYKAKVRMERIKESLGKIWLRVENKGFTC